MKYEDFKHTPVKGDGSCFFYSVATILLIDKTGKYPDKKSVNSKAKKLRKECVEWLKKNLTYKIKGTGFTIQQEIKEDLKYNQNESIKSIKDYLNHMKTPGAYAGQIEIYATTNMLKKNLFVYIHNNGVFNNSGLGYQINNKRNIMKDIFIYHNLGKTENKKSHHFEPLYPKKKLSKLKSLSKKSLSKKSPPKRRIKRTKRR